jgi:hypothetical protein
MLFKSSDVRLKDFYYDEGRNVIVSTKCPNEKDIKWRLPLRTKVQIAALGENNKVLKFVRKDRVREVFDVLITAAERQDMAYRSSPPARVYSASTQPEQCITPATEKKPSYSVLKLHNGMAVVGTYATLKAAQDEAESYAKHMPGTKYAVIQILGTVVATGVTWE